MAARLLVVDLVLVSERRRALLPDVRRPAYVSWNLSLGAEDAFHEPRPSAAVGAGIVSEEAGEHGEGG